MERKDSHGVDAVRLDRALAYAAKKHEGQHRIGGLPYITHPQAVADLLRQQGYDTDYQIAGLFHDLLEDTDATAEELCAIGGAAVLATVRLLTKEDGYDMADYIARIRANPMAFAVKGADRLHNLRCALVADEAFKRKYILESKRWYLDFSPQIPAAVRALADSLEQPIQDPAEH